MTNTRARKQSSVPRKNSRLRTVVIAGMRASVQSYYSEGEAQLCHTFSYNLCIKEPGSLSRINTTWSRQGLHSKAALLPRPRSLVPCHVRIVYYTYVRTHLRTYTCCVIHVHTWKCYHSNTSQWVFPVQRMSIYGVAKEVFEIKRRST